MLNQKSPNPQKILIQISFHLHFLFYSNVFFWCESPLNIYNFSSNVKIFIKIFFGNPRPQKSPNSSIPQKKSFQLLFALSSVYFGLNVQFLWAVCELIVRSTNITGAACKFEIDHRWCHWRGITFYNATC